MRRIEIEGNAGCNPGHSDQSQAEHAIFPKPWEVTMGSIGGPVRSLQRTSR
jgi:hypothetical protein